MDSRIDLNVVIPVYNEEEIIEFVVESWIAMLRTLGIRFRLTCINDESKDRTAWILDKLAVTYQELMVIHKKNSGHGPTIIEGYLKSADCDWIMQVDSDNEIGPEEFPALWAKRDECDAVFGIRSQRQSPLPRKIVSAISRIVIRTFYLSKVVDVNVPYRLLKTEKILPLIRTIPKDTFAPNLIISGFMGLFFLRYMEVPVSCRERQTGVVSIRKWRLLKVAAKSLWQTIAMRVTVHADRPRWLAVLSHIDEHLIKKPWLGFLIVTLMAVSQIARIDFLGDWWFEDDTVNLSYVAAHSSALPYFFDANRLSPPGMGTQPLPIQYVSYWMDSHIGQLNPAWAYAHTALLFLLTSYLLFAGMKKILTPFHSLLSVYMWMLLPSSIVINEYLSVRHYLYGMTFFLAALLSASFASSPESNGWRKVAAYALTTVFVFASLLSKQVYITAVLPACFLLFLYRKATAGLGLIVAIACVYGLYVHLLTGWDYQYAPSFVERRDIAAYLKAVVYTVSASPFFMFTIGPMAGITAFLALIRKISGREIYIFLTASLICLLAAATCFSVSKPILQTYSIPGTWYRAIFFFASAMVATWAFWCWRFLPRYVGLGLVLFTIIHLYRKSSETILYWQASKLAYRSEGQFVLENKDKILISKLPAWWFFNGLQTMYGLEQKNWILHALGENPGHADAEVWELQEKKFVMVSKKSDETIKK